MNRLNLMPEELKKEIAFSKENARLSQMLMKIVVVFVVLVAFIALLGFYVENQENVAEQEEGNSAGETAAYKSMEKEAQDFMARLSIVKKSTQTSVSWGVVLDEISKNVPSGMMIDSMDLPTDLGKRGKITGIALTDKDVSLFRDLLAKNKYFQYIDIESLSVGSDPTSAGRVVRNFVMSMNINYSGVQK